MPALPAFVLADRKPLRELTDGARLWHLFADRYNQY